ncbi:MAG: ribosomal RNA small subunit methyltransferase A [Deltaproteobacteria bacterium]|nr:ribosomal RNA small subunit methyltransferase A [Deltaproteobacteria bacterium]
MSGSEEKNRSVFPTARELLAKHGLLPKRSLGQNFLVDTRVQERIVDAARVSGQDVVVEIGAGLGALTARLFPRAASVIALERDASLARVLRAEFAGAANLQIVEADALKFDLVAAAQAAGRPLVVVGNLPYVVTSPVIFATLEAAAGGQVVDRAVLMVQKEFAQRMLSPPGGREYGRLSVMVQQAAETEILFHVGPGAFLPPPAVVSTVVRLRPRAQPLCESSDAGLFSLLVREAFGTRRKMLRRALEPAFGSARVAAALAAAGIAGTRRAEELSVADFVRLAQALAHA